MTLSLSFGVIPESARKVLFLSLSTTIKLPEVYSLLYAGQKELDLKFQRRHTHSLGLSYDNFTPSLYILSIKMFEE